MALDFPGRLSLFPGLVGQGLGIFQAEHRLGDVVLGQTAGLGGVGIAQDQNLTPDAGHAQPHCLGKAADCKPLRAAAGKRLGHRHVSMPIGVGLDHGAYRHILGVLADPLIVAAQSIQIDFRPAMFFKIQFHCPSPFPTSAPARCAGASSRPDRRPAKRPASFGGRQGPAGPCR